MQQWLGEMIARLSSAGYGQSAQVIEEYSKKTGKSKATLYRLAAKHKGRSSMRKKRKDTGTCTLTETQINWVAAQVHVSSRQVKGPIMPVEKALMIAQDNGIIKPGSISVSRMQSILKEREISARHLQQEKPHIRLKSLHPNHVHVVDMSVCIQYYIGNGKTIAIADERDYNLKKPENMKKMKRKLIRYVLSDHFSHSLFIKYYNATGENQNDLFDFLTSAWVKKDDRYPFRGVPFIMLTDAGSANMARSMSGFFEALEIKRPSNAVHNPRRQGGTECAQNIVERWFESGLRVQPASTVVQLNKWAMDFCIWFNAHKIHTRHRMTRTGCWLRIKPEQLRECPDMEICQNLFAHPDGQEATVYGDYTIRYKNNHYSVRHLPKVSPYDKIKVIVKPFFLPNLSAVYLEKTWELTPIGIDSAGFRDDAAVIGEEFKAVPETTTQKAVKQMEESAWGGGDKKQAPFAGIKTMGIHGDKVKVIPIPKTGHQIILTSESGIEESEISFMEFLKRLRARVGTITPGMNAQLRARLGESVSLREAEAIITQHTNCNGNVRRQQC